MRGNAVVTEHTTPQNQTAQEDERAWYAIHTYSGYENKVKSHLEARIASMDMRNKIFRVIVPMEEEVEIKQGQRRTVQRKVFPGYVLVEMIMSDEAWSVHGVHRHGQRHQYGSEQGHCTCFLFR